MVYQSDFTKFMDSFLEKNPEVEIERQCLSVSLLNKTINLDDVKRWQSSQVPQKPYVYQID